MVLVIFNLIYDIILGGGLNYESSSLYMYLLMYQVKR